MIYININYIPICISTFNASKKYIHTLITNLCRPLI